MKTKYSISNIHKENEDHEVILWLSKESGVVYLYAKNPEKSSFVLGYFSQEGAFIRSSSVAVDGLKTDDEGQIEIRNDPTIRVYGSIN